MVQLVQWLTCNSIFFFFLIRRLASHLARRTLEVAALELFVDIHLLRAFNQEFCLLLTNRLPWILPSIISLRTSYFFFYRIVECQWFFHSGMNFSIYYSLYPRYFQHASLQAQLLPQIQIERPCFANIQWRKCSTSSSEL